MARLKIHLLGPFLAYLDREAAVSFETEKTRALLAYLASESQRPHRREYLAELLWPGRPEGAGRANLRHALGTLRAALGDRAPAARRHGQPPYLLATRDTIQFNPASEAWVDVSEFETMLEGTTPDSSLRINQLEQAVDLYRGPFLEDITIGDSALFQEWVLLKREETYRRVFNALSQLTTCYRLWGKVEKALDFAWRLVALAPWSEETHQHVMRLLALSGQRAAALAQYEACRRFLRQELGVEPGAETTRLYDQIRKGSLEALRISPALPGETEAGLQLPGFLAEAAPEVEPQPIVGRERELADLDRSLHRMLEGRGGVLFITGVAGQGKTALLNEFARRALATDPRLLIARGNCNAYFGVGDPYLPFRHTLAMLTGDVETAWSAGAIGRDHARRLWHALPKAIPALAVRGSSLINYLLDPQDLFTRAAVSLPDHPACLGQLRALIEQTPVAAAGLEQTFLFEQYANFLLTLSEAHPIVLLLDDLQWVDDASVSLLFHLGRRIARTNQRLLIVAAYRPEEVGMDRAGGRHPLMKVLSEFKRMFGEVWVDLDQTDEAVDRRFVDSLLDREPNRLGEDFRAALFQRTQGHPLFTVELLRAMQDRGEVRRDEAGYWIEAPALDWAMLPARVQAVIEDRIGRLDPELQQILTTASVDGEVFTAQVVADVQKMAIKPLLNCLAQELDRRHQLVREKGEVKTGRGQASQFQFRHVLFQDYLYRRLSSGERRVLHQEVAAAIEKLYPDQPAEVAVRLALHWDHAGDYERAFPYYGLAARRAARLYATDEAIRHATRAIETAPDASPDKVALAKLYRLRGLAYERQGLFQQARDDFEQTLQIGRGEGDRQLAWRALLDLGKLWASRDYRQSQGFFTQALNLARQLEEPEALAGSLNWRGNWQANAEKLPEAIANHRQALQILEVHGDQRGMANTLDLLGIAHLLARDGAASKAYYDRAISMFRDLDERARLASSLTGRGNIGASHCSLSAAPPMTPCEALRDFEEALHIARAIGSLPAEAWALWSSALAYILQGEFGQALKAAERGLQIASDIEHREWIVGNRAVLGRLYASLFALDEARQQLEQALSLARELQSRHWIHNVTGSLAYVQRRSGDLAQAQSLLETVLSRQKPMDTLHIGYCWAIRADLALAQGEPDLALDITERLIRSAPGLTPGSVITYLWKLKGEALAALGQLEEGRALLCAALENARQTGERFLLWQLHAGLGNIRREMGCLSAAQNQLSLARAEIEALAATLPEGHLKQTFLAGALESLQPR